MVVVTHLKQHEIARFQVLQDRVPAAFGEERTAAAAGPRGVDDIFFDESKWAASASPQPFAPLASRLCAVESPTTNTVGSAGRMGAASMFCEARDSPPNLEGSNAARTRLAAPRMWRSGNARVIKLSAGRPGAQARGVYRSPVKRSCWSLPCPAGRHRPRTRGCPRSAGPRR